MSVAWIEFRKAFDLVPHQWVKATLKTIQAPQWIKRLLKGVIPQWKTDIVVRTDQGRNVALPVSFKRGLFQGDALSPFLFCMSVAPISRSLRSTPGIVSSFQPRKITHLLYMDDLKLYDSSRSEQFR